MKILIEKSGLASIRIQLVLGLLEAVAFVGIDDILVGLTGFLKRGDKFLHAQQATIAIQSTNANFVQGSMMANFGAGISVDTAALGSAGPITVSGPNTLT